MFLPEWSSYSRQKTVAFARRVFLLALSAGLSPLPALAGSEAYVPYSGIIHGTEGADPLAISITNETGATLDCQAALAHWYSDKLGQVAPGEALELTLWHDPETGVLNLMNATDDRMPVEALWCATGSDDAAAARTRIDLPMAEGAIRASLDIACRTDAGGLSCEAEGG